MDRRQFVVGTLVSVVASAAVDEANAATWVKLGERQVDGALDFDTITVGRSLGTFDHIMLKVRGNDLMILDLDVRYGNGANDDIPVRLLIPQGGQTRRIDLRANNRFIRNVRFTYAKFANGRGATFVELWGER